MAIATALIAALTGLWIARLVYTAFLSPLAAVPSAHPLAPFTKLWLLWLRRTDREHRVRYQLHRKLGPVIRLAPREVSVNCIDHGVSSVYKSDFDKPAWFASFGFFGQKVMFAMLSSREQGPRKRMVAGIYTNSYVQSSLHLELILKKLVAGVFVSRVRGWASEGKAVDIDRETKKLAVACTASYMFGLDAATRLLVDSVDSEVLLGSFNEDFDDVFWNEFPRLRAWLLRTKTILRRSKPSESQQAIKALAASMRDTAEKSMYAKPGSSEGLLSSYPVAYACLHPKIEESSKDSSIASIQATSELLDHVIAGRDGLSSTLTFLMRQLSLHKMLQQQLREEFTALHKDDPTAQDIDSLPLLDAVLMETMRLYPSGLGPFTRIVPGSGVQLGSYEGIPAGTTVSATVWALHRHEEVFPEPEEWRPERWLGTADRAEMMKWFYAFGFGNRTCIGNHFSMRMMKNVVYTVYLRYETSVEKGIETRPLDAFVSRPVGETISLIFHEIENSHCKGDPHSSQGKI